MLFLSTPQLDRNMVCWGSNRLTGWALRVTVTVVTSDWGPVPVVVLQGSILGPVLFNSFKRTWMQDR